MPCPVPMCMAFVCSMRSRGCVSMSTCPLKMMDQIDLNLASCPFFECRVYLLLQTLQSICLDWEILTCQTKSRRRTAQLAWPVCLRDGAARQPTETTAAWRKVTLEWSADCQNFGCFYRLPTGHSMSKCLSGIEFLILETRWNFSCYSRWSDLKRDI